MTLEEIGKKVGLTRERVRQIEGLGEMHLNYLATQGEDYCNTGAPHGQT